MQDDVFDQAMIGAVFRQAGLVGWQDVSLAEAGRAAGLELGRVRTRFPSRSAVLMRFGRLADQAALAAIGETAVRERLFDMLMARFDVLQQHRDGVQSVMVALRTDPATGLLLYAATLRSMAWLLDAAGLAPHGIFGKLRVHGLLAIWLYALRAWEQDASADLASTMAAVDRGLDRAVQAEAQFGRSSGPAEDAARVFEGESQSTL